MKFLVAVAAFIATIALTTQTLAKVKPGHKDTISKTEKVVPVATPAAQEEKAHEAAPEASHEAQASAEHGGGHGDLNTKMNSLFPTKMPNPEMKVRPSVVEIKSPSFLSSVGAGPVKLEWNEAKGATNYHLQVATDPNFKWLVVNEKFVKETNYNFSADAGKRYFWRVASYNGDNTSMFTKSNFVNSAFNTK